MSEAKPISVCDAFSGKQVLLTGASGFLGKVWLALMLERAPEVGRIYVLLRSKALVSAASRFEKIVNTSPAFARLHERLGPGFSELLAEKVEIVDGELSEPGMGLNESVARRLKRDLHIVVHCAGLVDFNPDLRKALASNVDATINVADFVEASEQAALLHVSTCYVAGRRYGQIEETVVPDYSPLRVAYDPERELDDAHAAARRICLEHESRKHSAEARADAEATVRQRRQGDRTKLVEGLARRRLREELKQALTDEGMERASRLGWPNTYTYTKSMAESLLWRRRDRIRMTIVRPSIVESSVEFPMPGWNESFNGSAPLAYVMGSWFRMIPARPNAPFDVIPVDMVCKAMSIAGAALLEGRHAPVYHVGSSDRNACSVGRAAELIVLAHRRHYMRQGQSRTERVWKSRFDAVLVEPDSLFSVDRNRALLSGVREALDMLPQKLRAKTLKTTQRIDRVDAKLAQIEQMVRLYLPFMYESFYVFHSRALQRTPALEPGFRFEPESIDWRKYWIEVHIPGLRRWAFPLIEGKRPERYRPEYPVRIAASRGGSQPSEAGVHATGPRAAATEA